ncbi:Thiol-disulfide oxidoreductase ResA [Gimesia panareensis]|uniref:Thiol-disulfide oxidoreductase ResA n=1 Tax=Gimesia panareensis TaxID=2527978 RepID=A0A517QD72_9PLAN|nr:TlpA disulfide reductase family protein [Gimesia panareensis]QDT29582.1 Thiol-disulfide oxidoreductase ResA [Gimesia panareensis]
MMNLRQTPVFFFQKMPFWSAVFCATLLISVSSCQSKAETEPAPTTSDPRQVTKSAARVPLEIGDWNRVEALVQEHQGQIVVVDLWSNSCQPCMQEFPEFVSLQKRFPEAVVCISFNCDYFGGRRHPPESFRPQVEQFLTKHQAHFPNILNNVASDEFFPSIDLASIPATYVFDQEGKVAKRFDNDHREYGRGGYTYQKDVIPFLESLLKQQPTK